MIGQPVRLFERQRKVVVVDARILRAGQFDQSIYRIPLFPNKQVDVDKVAFLSTRKQSKQFPGGQVVERMDSDAAMLGELREMKGRVVGELKPDGVVVLAQDRFPEASETARDLDPDTPSFECSRQLSRNDGNQVLLGAENIDVLGEAMLQVAGRQCHGACEIERPALLQGSEDPKNLQVERC
jgi:hypothetical protein